MLAVGATLVVGFGVRLDRALLTSGVFRTGKYGILGDQRYYKDGRTATVSVTMPKNGRLSIGTNGKPDGSLAPAWFRACQPGDSLQAIAGDDPTQVLLPLVTLATGSARSRSRSSGRAPACRRTRLLASPALESLVTIEIEPVMVEASRAF